IDNPFASVPLFATAAVPSSGPVVAFASRSGERYAAYAQSVWKSTDNGVSWVEITGTGNPPVGPLVDNVRQVRIFGLALDSNYPFMYLATGTGFGNTVWRTSLPASGIWTRFDAGLPPGIPITGIGIAPNRALYIATQGRGIWWRRDVAAVPPNSGVNSPDAGSSLVGMAQNFTTTCSYPTGWRNIRTIDFKMAMGHGPEDDEPLALWVQFDQDANLIRCYDPDTREWSEGAPGSNTVLSSRFAELRLADARVQGSGPTGPTVEITWAVVFRDAARGRLEQYLRVGDDFEANTSWDKVGVWRVLSPECATDVTAQIEVTRGEAHYNPGLQRYTQQVKIKNIGSAFIPGPIALVLEHLNEGVTLSDVDGSTACFDPLNRPFVMVRGGAQNGLRPGETGVVILEFASPADQGVNYIIEVLAGPGKR
ncbi:MAG TPA: hypothetical protein VNO70_07580, partial [Blastocatellia bacterium]|nr:hypothetical protein [Blastocatellia bacterium]